MKYETKINHISPGKIFERQDLSGSDFYRESLKSTNFGSTVLTGADFTEAILHDSYFGFGRLEGAIFRGADLRYVGFTDTHSMRNADFYGADLRNAFMDRTDCSGSDFTSAHLDKANFRDSDLIGAVLRGVTATDTKFDGTDFRDADLRGADLRGASLGGVKNLKLAKLKGVIIDDGRGNEYELAESPRTHTYRRNHWAGND